MVQSRRLIDRTPQVEAWRAANPVRKWLAAQPGSRWGKVRDFSARLGVSTKSVYQWMDGTSLPTAKKLVALSKIIQTTPSAYMKWWDRMPTEGTACVVQPQASGSTPDHS